MGIRGHVTYHLRWVVMVVVPLGVLAAIVVSGVIRSNRAANQRMVAVALKTFADAQAQFRQHDRDANGIQDFWTGDVKGLQDCLPAGKSEPIRLIPREVAEADPSHPNAKPFHGYWFAAVEKDEEGRPYRHRDEAGGVGGPLNRHPLKFGFCAFPAKIGIAGEPTFMINEGGSVYQQMLEGKPVTRFPTEDELGVRKRPLH